MLLDFAFTLLLAVVVSSSEPNPQTSIEVEFTIDLYQGANHLRFKQFTEKDGKNSTWSNNETVLNVYYPDNGVVVKDLHLSGRQPVEKALELIADIVNNGTIEKKKNFTSEKRVEDMRMLRNMSQKKQEDMSRLFDAVLGKLEDEEEEEENYFLEDDWVGDDDLEEEDEEVREEVHSHLKRSVEDQVLESQENNLEENVRNFQLWKKLQTELNRLIPRN